MKNRRRGQALAEFVVAVPVFVVMLFFAWYFSDLVQLRLDTQEMARLVAWDATNRNMHDFADGNHRGRQRQVARDAPEAIRNLYRDMDPSRDEANMPRKLTIERAIDTVEMTLGRGPAGNDRVLSSGFEAQGVVTSNVVNTATGLDDFFPHNMLVGTHFDSNPFGKMRQTLRFTDSYSLLADSWRLHDGQDVLPADADKDFTKQVHRISWSIEGLEAASQAWAVASVGLGIATGSWLNPFQSVVASRNYTGDAASGRRTTAHGLKVSGGQDDFDTAPMRVNDRDGNGSVYGRTLEKRSNKYLGCRTLTREAQCFR